MALPDVRGLQAGPRGHLECPWSKRQPVDDHPDILGPWGPYHLTGLSGVYLSRARSTPPGLGIYWQLWLEGKRLMSAVALKALSAADWPPYQVKFRSNSILALPT